MKIKVSVPATSANIGSGFDALGLAVTLYNTVTFEESDHLDISAADGTRIPRGETNLVYRSAKGLFDKVGIALQVVVAAYDESPDLTGPVELGRRGDAPQIVEVVASVRQRLPASEHDARPLRRNGGKLVRPEHAPRGHSENQQNGATPGQDE